MCPSQSDACPTPGVAPFAANLPVWQVEYGSSSTGTTFFQTVCKCQSTWGVKSIYKVRCLSCSARSLPLPLASHAFVTALDHFLPGTLLPTGVALA
jgi:hypothetical protein